MTNAEPTSHPFRTIARNWNVSVAYLDQVFGGFHSRRFTEKLSQLSSTHDIRTALPALQLASRDRREGKLGQRIAANKQWQPVDIEKASTALMTGMPSHEPKRDGDERKQPTHLEPDIEHPKIEPDVKPPEPEPSIEPDIDTSKMEPDMEDAVAESPQSSSRTSEKEKAWTTEESISPPSTMGDLAYPDSVQIKPSTAFRGLKRPLSHSDDTPEHCLSPSLKLPRASKRILTSPKPCTTEVPHPTTSSLRSTIPLTTPKQSLGLATPRTWFGDAANASSGPPCPPPEQHIPIVLPDTDDDLWNAQGSTGQSSLLYRPLPAKFSQTLLSMGRLDDRAVNTCLNIIASVAAPRAFQVIPSQLIKPDGRPPSAAFKKPILAAETIFAPLHLSESNHWLLCCVSRVPRQMVVYDSLQRNATRHRQVERLVEVLARDYFDFQPSFDVAYQYAPLQHNDVDCGVFLLIHAVRILAGRPLVADSPPPNAQIWRHVFASLDPSTNVPDLVPSSGDLLKVEIDMDEAPPAPPFPSGHLMSAQQWAAVKAKHTEWQQDMDRRVQRACDKRLAQLSSLMTSVRDVQGFLQQLSLLRVATAAGPVAAEIDTEISARQQILQALKMLPHADTTDDVHRRYQAARLVALGEARTYKLFAESAFMTARLYLDRQQDAIRERTTQLGDYAETQLM